VYGSTASRTESDRVVAEWLANGRRSLVAAGDLTVVELVAAYVEHANAHYVKNGRPMMDETGGCSEGFCNLESTLSLPPDALRLGCHLPRSPWRITSETKR
jgi:hypothetical protein